MHAVDSYVLPLQVGVQVEHARLEFCVHAVVSYVPDLQVLRQVVHCVSLSLAQLAVTYDPAPHDEHALQRVFDEPPQSATLYVPAPQVLHALQLPPDMYPQQEQPPVLQSSQLSSQPGAKGKKSQCSSQLPVPTVPPHHELPGR